MKPANVLIKNETDLESIKIADFGFSTYFDQKVKMKECLGSKIYMAPEILLKELDLKYNEKVDIWALGILIFYLIGGEDAVSYKNVDGNMVRTHNALKMAM